MHGHSYRLEVAIRGQIRAGGPARGMVEDFETVERVVRERVLDRLDHHYLNDLIDNPTVENIVRWIWDELEPGLRGLDEVVLWETRSACAVLRRDDTLQETSS